MVHFDVNLDGRYVTAVAEEPLPTGTWSHVAGMYDGDRVALFVNGHRVDSRPGTGKRKTNDLPLYLGADLDSDGAATRSFIGQLDEFRLSTGVRYTEDFTPDRRHQPDGQTVLSHHLDRIGGPFVLDHSRSAADGRSGRVSELVPVE